jgi:very-short-patch-repair endonuclease
MSPKGEPMQLDIYYPQLRLAFEYDGSQHKKYNSYFFKNKKQFEYLQRCDRLKNRICKEIGIELIRINYDKKITLDYIAKKLQDAGYGEYIKDNYEREKQKNK